MRALEVPAVELVPRALGYGSVRPEMVWEAVAEVGGQVVETHAQLKKGAILGKGEVLLRIDPERYELAATQAEATIGVVEAELAELRVREANTRASLAIDRRSLELSRKDLERKRQLLKRGAVSQAAVDQEERNTLGFRQNVQTLENTLNLIPAERQALAAERALQRAQLRGARLDLERTTIVAPFDCRVAEVRVERSQYVTQGQVLVVADSIGVSEVTAQVPLAKLINLVRRGGTVPADASQMMARLPELLSLSAVVRLGGGVDIEWQARFARVSDTIDPETRTVGVIVAVDNPYRQAIPGVRPPLSKNMYVEVELRGRSRPGQIVIPRAALHQGRVYVVGAGNRLEMRDVKVAFFQANFAVIKRGLTAGERVVVSDPVPAIEGMLLDAVDDGEARARLIAAAEGGGRVR